MIEKIFALVVLAACVVMLLRLCLGRRQQRQLDAAGLAIARFPRSLVHRMRASRGAAEAIRRAKDASLKDGDWKGNVYTPKSFRRPRKPH